MAWSDNKPDRRRISDGLYVSIRAHYKMGANGEVDGYVLGAMTLHAACLLWKPPFRSALSSDNKTTVQSATGLEEQVKQNAITPSGADSYGPLLVSRKS